MSFFNFLEYRCYAYNRVKHPDLKPVMFRHVFDNWEDYEERFQREMDKWIKMLEEEDEIDEALEMLEEDEDDDFIDEEL